ncbi:MAG: hypothetical protein IT239_03360, partial [Bacteroidia bacterium]|nr:hypothetical protein [Bacteroidia bacterium]
KSPRKPTLSAACRTGLLRSNCLRSSSHLSWTASPSANKECCFYGAKLRKNNIQPSISTFTTSYIEFPYLPSHSEDYAKPNLPLCQA